MSIFYLHYNVPFLAVAADPRVSRHQGHPQQAGRLHSVLVPRLHLRAQPLAAQQPACRKGRHQAEAPDAIAVQQWLEQTLPTGKLYKKLS